MYRKNCMYLGILMLAILFLCQAMIAFARPAQESGLQLDISQENLLAGLLSENGQADPEGNGEAGIVSAISTEVKSAILVGVQLQQTCQVLPKTYLYQISSEERTMLEKIVEAEAGGEELEGKRLVANVVLNRVQDDAFPDSVSEVIFQKTQSIYQFSPVQDGRYESVTVSEETKLAVEQVLLGEDSSEGALYFMAREQTSESKARWFDANLTRLFSCGGHEFFK